MSGGLLLAAGLDGGNTMIFAAGENATNLIIHPRKDTRLDTISSLVFLFYVGMMPGMGCCSNFFRYIGFCGGMVQC